MALARRPAPLDVEDLGCLFRQRCPHAASRAPRSRSSSRSTAPTPPAAGSSTAWERRTKGGRPLATEELATEKEGRLAVDEAGHEIYYRLFGDGEETLVVLHGGPGADHRYLTRLGELAGDGLQVLLYDQLGGGKSDVPDDPALWVVPRFVEELEPFAPRSGSAAFT